MIKRHGLAVLTALLAIVVQVKQVHSHALRGSGSSLSLSNVDSPLMLDGHVERMLERKSEEEKMLDKIAKEEGKLEKLQANVDKETEKNGPDHKKTKNAIKALEKQQAKIEKMKTTGLEAAKAKDIARAEAVAAREAAKKAAEEERQKKKEEREAQKAAEKAAKEAAKAEMKKKREEEKAAKEAARAAEREKKRLEKEAKRAARMAEKEARKKKAEERKKQRAAEKEKRKAEREKKKKERQEEKKRKREERKKKKQEERKKKLEEKGVKVVVIPENCEEVTSQVEIPCPIPPPYPLPKMCTGFRGSWSGDPHFKTFDGAKYDCQGEGEFVVVQSLDSDFELQGRFVKFSPDRRPTVTKAIAFVTGDGEPKIQVNVDEAAKPGTCKPTLSVDGAEWDISKPIEGIRVEVTHQGMGMVLLYEQSDIQLTVKSKLSGSNGCVLATDLCIPDCYERMLDGETFVGLLGIPDGDMSNEWMDPDGKGMEVQSDFESEYDYCVSNWCIEDEEDSLFSYAGDKSFADYMHCDLGGDEETAACLLDPDGTIPGLEAVCGDDRDCLVDGCIGGLEAAELYVTMKSFQVDKNCGKEIFFEDFEGEDDGDWGEIVRKAKSKVKGAKKKTHFLKLDNTTPLLEKTFDKIPVSASLVEISMLFYEIGGWTDADDVTLIVGSTDIDIGAFMGNKKDAGKLSGVTGGIYWERKSVTKNANLGFNGVGGDNKDEIHLLKLMVTPEYFKSGKLDLKIDLQLSGDTMIAGIDNLKLVAFRSTCELDCDGTSVIEDTFEGVGTENDWGTISELEDGSSVLGPLQPDDSVFKTFQIVDFGAASAKVNFELYALGDWMGNLENKFLVTIGNMKFNIGPFDELTQAEIDPIVTEDEEESEETLKEDIVLLVGAPVVDVPMYVGEEDDGEIYWERTFGGVADGIMGQSGDTIYQVTIEVSDKYFEDGLLTVGFEVDAVDNVKAAVDDFSIDVYPDREMCEEAKKDEQNNKELICDMKGTGLIPPIEPEVCYVTVTDLVCTPTAAPTVDSLAPSVNIDTPAPTPADDTPAPTPADDTPAPTPADDTPAPTPAGDTPAPTAAPTPPNRNLTPRPTPAPAPTKPPTYISGDPHIKTWSGDHYDFHGECELVLLSNPDFNDGQGMWIHVRTKIKRWWSYIESAAVKIGDDVLEVKSGVEDRKYWINGVEGHRFQTSRNLDWKIGGFSGRFRAKNEAVLQYKLYLPDNQFLVIRSVRDMLHVELMDSEDKYFEKSVGLMGSYVDGSLVGRNGTVIEDINAFGQEWQVQFDEPHLFHEKVGPQHPQKCRMPDMDEASAEHRRLSSNSLGRDEAEAACAHVSNKGDFNDCVMDVMSTDDVEMAEAY